MPFGKLDYLGNLTKFPKFHRAGTIKGGPARGESTHVDFYIFIVIFLLEPAYRSDVSLKRKVMAPEGPGPIRTRAFLCISRSEFIIFVTRARKWGKIAPEIGKSYYKPNSLITQKRFAIRNEILLTTNIKLGSRFPKKILTLVTIATVTM